MCNYSKKSDLGGNSTTQTGTPTYCNAFHCDIKSQRFCYFQAVSPAFAVDERDKVAVMAWGSVEKKYFPFPSLISSCARCLVHCAPSGILLTTTADTSHYEVCSGGTCVKKTAPAVHEAVHLEMSVLLKKYDVEVQVWIKGVKTILLRLSCSAVNICNAIPCSFCWERFGNPHCHLFEITIIVVMFVYAMIAVIYTSYRLIRYSIKKARQRFGQESTVNDIPLAEKSSPNDSQHPTVQKTSTKKGPPTPPPPPRQIARRRSFSYTPLAAASALIFVTVASACSDVEFASTINERCVISNDELRCSFDHTATLDL